MAQTKLIKDKSGRLVGRVEDGADERIAYDSTGHLVGRYRKRQHQTVDGSGRLITTSGDALSDLLFKRKR